MELTCPHCQKCFEVNRPGRTSVKANAARKRNAQLSKKPPKVSRAQLLAIFSAFPGCTGEAFKAAVEKVAGFSYSRSQAFAILKKLKDQSIVRSKIIHMSQVGPYVPALTSDKRNILNKRS